MHNWREVPFVRLLLPFIIGIVLGLYFDSLFHFLTVFLLLLFLLIGWLTQLRLSPSQKNGYSILVQLFLTIAGYQLAVYQNDYHNKQHFRHALAEKNILIGTVTDVTVSDRFINTTLHVEAIGSPEGHPEAALGHIMLFIKLNDVNHIPAYGNRLTVNTSITTVSGPKNPKVFDYRHYLRMKGIYHQGYVNDKEWAVLEARAGQPFMSWANQLRKQLLNVLQHHLTTPNEFAVGAAMLLGYRDALSESITNVYAGTGAMHVMAVSGLHIGLVFWGLGLLLRLIPWRNRFLLFFKPIAMLFGIWLFASLTGASPSAMRAAFMFSLLIIGRSINEGSNIYNTLAASAFCLLCYNPFLIMEIGFQLSYLAVGGIVYFQPKIVKWWYFEYKWCNYLWALVSVGIAAQITTLPLSLLYFHQFPLYFWLSGIVVVPMASIIIILGGLLFFTHAWLPFVSSLVGKLLYGCIWLMNALIALIRELPAGLIEGIWISAIVFLLLNGIVISFVFWINSQKIRWGIYSLGIMVIVMGITAFTAISQQQQAKIVIYHIPKHSMIDCISGTSVIQLSDPLLSQKKKKWVSSNFRNYSGIKNVNEQILGIDTSWQNEVVKYHSPLLQFYNTRLAFIQTLPPQPPTAPIPVNYLLLHNNPEYSISTFQEYFHFDTLLMDASNKSGNIDYWVQDCVKAQIPFKNGFENGAIILYPQIKNITQ